MAAILKKQKQQTLKNKKIKTHLSLEGINNELKSLRLDTFNALLYHMVPILVFHTLQHMAVKLTDNVALNGRKWYQIKSKPLIWRTNKMLFNRK